MIRKLLNSLSGLFEMLPESLIALVARLALFNVFWNSVQTKLYDWNFLDQNWKFYDPSPSTFSLFKYEYQIPYVNYEVATYLATMGEFFFSLMLLLGLATRLSAFGLLMMTLVIQLFVLPESWPTHMFWAIALLYLIRQGGGKVAFDNFLGIK